MKISSNILKGALLALALFSTTTSSASQCSVYVVLKDKVGQPIYKGLIRPTYSHVLAPTGSAIAEGSVWVAFEVKNGVTKELPRIGKVVVRETKTISAATYRKVLKPVYDKAILTAYNKGLKEGAYEMILVPTGKTIATGAREVVEATKYGSRLVYQTVLVEVIYDRGLKEALHLVKLGGRSVKRGLVRVFVGSPAKVKKMDAPANVQVSGNQLLLGEPVAELVNVSNKEIEQFVAALNSEE